MDKTLADFYDTLGAVEPSQEQMAKTAELELLEKIAEEGDIDLTKLSDEQIVEAYNELAGTPEETTDDDMEKDAAADMVKQADYMGRIMAHAYVDELKSIQKHAEEGGEPEPEKKGNPLLAAVQKKKEEAKEDKGEDKEKDAAFQESVEKRAFDILNENGLVNEDGTIVPPDALQKQAEEEKVAVDTAAWQVLADMGYPVNTGTEG